jgi:hypothetical protein
LINPLFSSASSDLKTCDLAMSSALTWFAMVVFPIPVCQLSSHTRSLTLVSRLLDNAEDELLLFCERVLPARVSAVQQPL